MMRPLQTMLVLFCTALTLNAQMKPWRLPLEHKALGPYTSLNTLQTIRPQIGLALSGGGARGLAQIGVLQVLEQHAIPVDYITGTSIGAIIGGLSAVGYSATEIESLAVAFDWDTIIQRTPPRQQLFLTQKSNTARHLVELHFQDMHLVLPSAFSNGQAFTTMLTDLVYNAPSPPVDNFDQLKTPFRAIATDLVTGEKVAIGSGSLIDAMRASMAIPLLFTPIEISGRQLVDGGLVDNLPSEEAIAMGADHVLAVDTSSPLHRANALSAPWVIADQVTTIMMLNQLNQSKTDADLLLTPVLEGVTNLDFKNIPEIIAAGRASAVDIVDSLDQLLTGRIKTGGQQTEIQSLEITGLVHLNRETFDALMGIADLPISIGELQSALYRLAEDGRIARLSAQVDSTLQHCHLSVTESPLVRQIRFIGNAAISDSSLLAQFGPVIPGPINTRHLSAKLSQLIEHYKSKGFSLAAFDTVFVDETSTLNIGLSEGRISAIDLIGIHHTKPWVVYREMPFCSGELVKSSTLSTALRNIYSTGYFEEVRVSVYPADSAGQHLFFFLKEKSQGRLKLGMRYDRDRHIAGFMEVGQNNLLGLGIEGTLRGLAGQFDQSFTLDLRSNRLMFSYLTADLQLILGEHRDYFYENLIEQGEYSTSRRSATITLGQQMGRLGTVSVRFHAEEARLQHQYNDWHENLNIFSLGIRSEVDTRDRTPFTMRGMHHRLDYETAAGWVGNDEGYTRLESLIETYHSTARFWTLHPRLHWGSSDLTTPFYKQFKIGGLESMPLIPHASMSGRRFVAFSAELRCNLPWPSWLSPHLSIRFDIAGAWKNYNAIQAEDFKRGSTLILGAETYLGPLYLSYGRLHNGGSHFFFSLGHRFSLK